MPRIRLPEVPHHLVLKIAAKLDHRSYINFEQSSRDAKEVAEAVKSRIYIRKGGELCPRVAVARNGNGGTPNVSFTSPYSRNTEFIVGKFSIAAIHLIIRDELNDVFCQELIDFFLQISPKVKEIVIDSRYDIMCSPESLNYLLESINATRFSSFTSDRNVLPSPQYFTISAIKKMKKIHALCQPLSNSEILNLDAQEMYFKNGNNFTSYGINQFLKQYISGSRRIIEVRINLNACPNVEDVFAGIRYKPLSESLLGRGYKICHKKEKLNIFLSRDCVWIRRRYPYKR